VRLHHPAAAEGHEAVETTQYEFRIKGKVGDRALASFDGFDAEIEPAETVLRGKVVDQAALHGVLEHIQDLGLELVEVRRVHRSA
jgi:hypothetical protein